LTGSAINRSIPAFFFRNSETSRMDARTPVRRLAPPKVGYPLPDGIV